MKKVSLIVFVLIASFFLSCSSTSTLKVSRDQMKSYKKIIIIPLYVPDQMMQKDYKDNVVGAYYPDEFKTELYKLVNENKHFYDSWVEKIMKEGRYKFQTLIHAEKIDSQIEVETQKSSLEFGKYSWMGNLWYGLNPEYIKKITKENDADLVLFHYLQCGKHSAFVEGGWGYKKYGPYDSLRYYGKIYDKNGNIVFDTTGEKDAKIALIMEYYKDSVIFGTLKVRPTLEKLKEQLTEKNINFNLGYNNYDEKAYYGEFVAR
ncbi:MAG TPA: hypothetical protein PLE16_02605 [Spirochaetota bacterium]|nr:hypothetical protein [Spirochaetota bacterium]HPM33475.1 hypothetical protein [Spirochaetota bacterium]HQA52415.1 hypothetical protein [Spirochaetota bacterium]